MNKVKDMTEISDIENNDVIIKLGKKLKIALAVFPEMGHFLPLTHIGYELTRRGH